MERWARGRFAGRAHFLCVSCAGPELAKEMGQHAKLKMAVNGYIADQANMPRWGQLGCNGFILLDARQRTVSPQTAAFLQVRERAFRDLEQKLDSLLSEEVELDAVSDPTLDLATGS